MLKQNWSIKNEIIKRVQKESEVEWANNGEKGEIPKYQRSPKVKWSVGLKNFIKYNVKQLQP